MIVFDNLNPISENYKPSVVEYIFPTITFKKNWTICTTLRNNAPNLLIFFHSTMFMTANNFWRLCSGLFRTPHLATAMGQRAQQVVQQNAGAAKRTVDGVFETIPKLAIAVRNIRAKAA